MGESCRISLVNRLIENVQVFSDYTVNILPISAEYFFPTSVRWMRIIVASTIYMVRFSQYDMYGSF